MCFDNEIPKRIDQKVLEKKSEKKVVQPELEKIEERSITA